MEKLESDIKLELEKYKIEEFDILNVGGEWWVQIYMLDEETIDYVTKSIEVLDKVNLNVLRNFDCKVSIREDKGVYYILAKFITRKYPSYNYSSGTTWTTPTTTRQPWSGSSIAPSGYPSGFEEEEEEGHISELIGSNNEKFLITPTKRASILSQSRNLPMNETELKHIGRIISDRIWSEEVPSLSGPSSLPGGYGYYWRLPSRTITIFKITSQINPQTRDIIQPKLPSSAYYTCYLVDVSYKSSKKEKNYFLTSFNELRKMEFYD
jgi:hypothetical protein